MFKKLKFLSYLKVARLVIIQIIVLLILLEISSTVIVHSFQSLSWQSKNDYFLNFAQTSKYQSAWNLKLKPHPFFGFVLEDAIGNNFGFNSHYNFPIFRKANEIVVGIFGGSVASGVGELIEDNNEYFEEFLRSKVPEWINKKITFVNLALGGYRQPQQFFLASYFIEMLDYALFLDGANEISGAPYPTYPLNFPKLTPRFFSTPNEDYWKKKKILFYREIQSSLLELAIKFKYLRLSSTFYLFFTTYEKMAHKIVEQLSDDMVTRQVEKATKYYPQLHSTEEIGNLLIKNWIKYFKLSHSILKENGVVFINFIQPSQYVKGAKVFTKTEKIEALDQNGFYDKIFSTRIKELSKISKKLSANGYPVCDLTKLYKNIKEQIFIDKFCHVNSNGEMILAKAIIEELSKTVNSPYNKVNCNY